ncbi:hypothetical protein G9C85_18115 [Halorubellus sp. JP-L1]|uniref:hypothetical protein n=1 Tax=Halorubellus sp. JP-L1 TaxID=2715753 RepID=UPI00140DC3F3|nr:hypothetical protein [Halorubellus sp. JP-L1]NHN43537.1 hypothetical protein [Halorubellus sp. JP-L1]
MDTGQLKELVPHYLAMILLVFGVLTVVRTAVGDLGFWSELVVVAAIAFAYRPVVVRLGVAPSVWE